MGLMKIPAAFLPRAIAVLLVLMPMGANAEFRQESLDNDIPAEITEAAAAGKHLVIFFHQLGCPYCDKMRARVHPNPKVMDYYSKHFIMIESNIKGNLEVVMPDGSKGRERDLAKKIRIRATPVFIFFDKTGKEVLKTTGYMDVERFYLAGKYVVEGGYKSGKSFFRYLQDQAK